MAEGIMKEATSRVPDDPTEVVSEDEGRTSLEDIVCLEGAISKGTANRSNPYSISVSNKKQKMSSVCPTVLSTQKQDRERICCIFPGSVLEHKKQIDRIFA
jgi:hypothetical protein